MSNGYPNWFRGIVGSIVLLLASGGCAEPGEAIAPVVLGEEQEVESTRTPEERREEEAAERRGEEGPEDRGGAVTDAGLGSEVDSGTGEAAPGDSEHRNVRRMERTLQMEIRRVRAHWIPTSKISILQRRSPMESRRTVRPRTPQ